MKFRISNVDPYKIYEDTGDVKKDRLVMYATPSGALFEGPGLGNRTEELYNAVPDSMAEKILDHWRKPVKAEKLAAVNLVSREASSSFKQNRLFAPNQRGLFAKPKTK